MIYFPTVDEVVLGEFASSNTGSKWDEEVSSGRMTKILEPSERDRALLGASLEKSAADEWDEQITGELPDETVLLSRVMRRFTPAFKTTLLAIGVDRESAADATAELSTLFSS